MPKIRIRRTPSAQPASEPATTPEVQEEDGGLPIGAALLGAGGLALAGAVARRPGMIGKGLKTLNDVRLQSMLSGLALPKSLLGNVGAVGVASAERRSLKPLKEFFKGETWRDAKAAYKASTPYGTTRAVAAGQMGLPGIASPATNNLPNWLPTPGRIMGAFDEATQNALRRAGMSADDAARETLQAPLPPSLAKHLEGEFAQYAIPFRRTPFNQFLEGLDAASIKNFKKNPALLSGITGAGAVHGAITSEDRYPVSVGLGTAASARYGLPYAGGAILGRMLSGGKTGGSIAGTMLPVSEYGIESSITDPLRPFREPAALKALQRLAGGEY
jgi:hypothetical protein